MIQPAKHSRFAHELIPGFCDQVLRQLRIVTDLFDSAVAADEALIGSQVDVARSTLPDNPFDFIAIVQDRARDNHVSHKFPVD